MLVIRILHHENIKDLARLVRIYRSNLKEIGTKMIVYVLQNVRLSVDILFEIVLNLGVGKLFCFR